MDTIARAHLSCSPYTHEREATKDEEDYLGRGISFMQAHMD